MKFLIRKVFTKLLLSFLILTISINLSYGQDEKYPRGAQYFLGTNDQLLIKVNIWGFVAKPGQYLVPSDTDLISLISFAGGPVDGAKLSKIKIIRAALQKSKKQNIIIVNVKKFTKKGDASIIPRIQPGDTIIIDGSKWFHFSKYLEVVGRIAVLIQIYAFIAYYTTLKR